MGLCFSKAPADHGENADHAKVANTFDSRMEGYKSMAKRSALRRASARVGKAVKHLACGERVRYYQELVRDDPNARSFGSDFSFTFATAGTLHQQLGSPELFSRPAESASTDETESSAEEGEHVVAESVMKSIANAVALFGNQGAFTVLRDNNTVKILVNENVHIQAESGSTTLHAGQTITILREAGIEEDGSRDASEGSEHDTEATKDSSLALRDSPSESVCSSPDESACSNTGSSDSASSHTESTESVCSRTGSSEPEIHEQTSDGSSSEIVTA